MRNTRGSNHGKRPRKFNQGCTICHSCRWAMSDCVVPGEPEERDQLAGISVPTWERIQDRSERLSIRQGGQGGPESSNALWKQHLRACRRFTPAPARPHRCRRGGRGSGRWLAPPWVERCDSGARSAGRSNPGSGRRGDAVLPSNPWPRSAPTLAPSTSLRSPARCSATSASTPGDTLPSPSGPDVELQPCVQLR